MLAERRPFFWAGLEAAAPRISSFLVPHFVGKQLPCMEEMESTLQMLWQKDGVGNEEIHAEMRRCHGPLGLAFAHSRLPQIRAAAASSGDRRTKRQRRGSAARSRSAMKEGDSLTQIIKDSAARCPSPEGMREVVEAIRTLAPREAVMMLMPELLRLLQHPLTFSSVAVDFNQGKGSAHRIYTMARGGRACLSLSP